jgi:signal transduction histidine kinase
MELQRIDDKMCDVGPHIWQRKILEIVDSEKQRLGRELHDGLCQTLAGIAALSSVLARSLAACAEPGPAAAAEEIVSLLNEAIGEVRDLAQGLGPIGLSGAGLPDGLETLARNVSHMHRACCTFTWDGRPTNLRPESKSHLLRIAQEAARNALAHGRADQIDICLECAAASGLLSIRDNGVGLSDDYRNRGGIGLHTMEYRAGAVGGCLTVARRHNGGTLVACSFPLPLADDNHKGVRDGLGRAASA